VDAERDGQKLELFLQRARSGSSPGASFIDFAREAEVCRALRPLGIPVPRVWGVDVGLNAMLVDRAQGVTWFHAPKDQGEAVSVARDFIGHLATWHAVPARQLELPSFRPIRTVSAHQRDVVRAIRADFESQNRRQPLDALAWHMLDLLEHQLPDYDGEPVLVQGDTGPGNLMYLDGRVSAIVDWELAHVGDPMDDIAWLSWRATQHTFPDFPARMREYEQASGYPIDEARVRYYRVNAVARLGPWFGVADMGYQHRLRAGLGSGPEEPNSSIDRATDGSVLIMAMLHRRMRLTALAAAMGIELPGRGVEVQEEVRDHAGIYDAVLTQLQGIAGRVEDRTVAAMAKGTARQVKYLKEIDRSGRRFEQRELDDIGGLLHRRQQSLPEARQRLSAAALDGAVPIEDYVLYHWRRLIHEDHLLRTASGALYERTWPALI
jgi:aminoglycoside phosphotransferase (APT) family kinase protein